MGDYCCRIEKMTNGYEVELCDPAIVKKNSSSKGTYANPMKSFCFNTIEEVLAFLKKNLDKALPDDEYSSSFDAAVADDDEDED